GEEGAAGIVPPNATLIFDVELLQIVSGQPAEVTEPSGLKYTDTLPGCGRTAASGQRISVHYTGRLEDGTVFDSSLEGGEPYKFTLGAGDVIEGWDVGIVGMKEGGQRKLTIPPELAYGERGSAGIQPNSTLIFDVELLEIISPAGGDDRD
ncbi:MAG: FKBP-type peptidyl-prolyl cis-trans isomerase, partial [Gammaproteobacteria bacterium]